MPHSSIYRFAVVSVVLVLHSMQIAADSADRKALGPEPDGELSLDHLRDLMQVDIYTQDISTGESKRLTNSPLNEEYPSISNNGKTVLFCQGALYRLDVDSLAYSELVNSDLECRESQWIPGARSISITGLAERRSRDNSLGAGRDIYVVDENGANLRNITNTASVEEYSHDWSFDGSLLAYVVKGAAGKMGWEIWLDSPHDPQPAVKVAEFRKPVAKLAWGSGLQTLYCLVSEGSYKRVLSVLNLSAGVITPVPDAEFPSIDWNVSKLDNTLVYRGKEGFSEFQGFESLFTSSHSVDGDRPRPSENGLQVVYTRRGYPVGFEEDVKNGRRPKGNDMIVIKKDGTIEYKTDWFNNQTPVVAEFPEKGEKQVSIGFRNLTKEEAQALLMQKSVQLDIALDDIEWEQ